MEYGSGSEKGTPFLPKGLIDPVFNGAAMMGRPGPYGELLTATPFLKQWVPSDPRSLRGPEEVREDEPWTAQTETLLYTWSKAWDQKAEAHGRTEGRARRGHLMLQIPTVLIPIILAPILAAKLVEETNFGVIIALIVSGLVSTAHEIVRPQITANP